MKLRNNENRIAFIIVGSVLIFVSLLWLAFKTPGLNPRLKKKNYTILRTWELPKKLDEISGIAWIGDNKMACVQDEEGVIFIYNLKAQAIEKSVNFAKGGDYEGVAVADSTAYVLRSDGELFEVINYLSENVEVKNYSTPFSGKNNMESLTFDEENNRLLLMPKDKDLENKSYLGVYAFNLETKTMEPNPVLTVSFSDQIFGRQNKKDDKKASNALYPSDIAINPLNGNIYIVEGKNPQLLILDENTKPVMLTKLSQKTFKQPEGIIFSEDGTLYISNEGKNGTANIMEVKLDE